MTFLLPAVLMLVLILGAVIGVIVNAITGKQRGGLLAGVGAAAAAAGAILGLVFVYLFASRGISPLALVWPLVAAAAACWLVSRKVAPNVGPDVAFGGAVAFTDQGEPVYPVVGYTPSGQTVTANQVVGGMRAFNPRTNSLATVSLILAFVLTPLAIPFGHVARAQIRRTGEQGAGLALAALIVAYVWMAFAVVAFVVIMSASNGRY